MIEGGRRGYFQSGRGSPPITSADGATRWAGTAGSLSTSGADTDTPVSCHYEATQDSSDAKKLQAEGKRFEGLGALLDDLMDAAMLRLKGSGERYNGMLEALIENVKDRGETLNRIGARV